MTEHLILAIDGGQSKSIAVLASREGHLLGMGQDGPANHFLEPGGAERFRTSMYTCITGAFEEAGLPMLPLATSYYCLTGTHKQMESILQDIAPSAQQIIAGDKEASLEGATRERPAVMVLAGTGSIAYGEDLNGHQALTGGWGYIMGDEGSAAWIAPRALSAATCADDGRGPATVLTQLIPHHFGVKDLRALHPLIYTQRIDRVALASIARVVGEAALSGDDISLLIMAQAGQQLGAAAVAVLGKLGLMDSPVIITSAGGVFKSGHVIIDPLLRRIHKDCPLAHYEPPRYPPVIGALMLAMESINIPISPTIIANIDASRAVWDARK